MTDSFILYHGGCLEVMRGMEADSVDAIVTDPPYGLNQHAQKDIVACLQSWLNGQPYQPRSRGGFMNKGWDAWVPGPEVWRECYRVLKPGGYLLSFAGTRSFDLIAIALRLVGFEQHPFIAWAFGSGFPKATSLSRMMDKAAGAEREVVGKSQWYGRNPNGRKAPGDQRNYNVDTRTDNECNIITAPATDAARQWEGWFYGKQCLKPAIEPILMFQKPPEGKMVDNVLKYGTGGLNVAACRVQGTDMPSACKGTGWAAQDKKNAEQGYRPKAYYDQQDGVDYVPHSAGRFPANLLHDNSPEVVDLFPTNSTGCKPHIVNPSDSALAAMKSKGWGSVPKDKYVGFDDGSNRSAARFFQSCPDNDLEDAEARRLLYVSKASRADRDEGCEGLPLRRSGAIEGRNRESGKGQLDGPTPMGNNTHNTVKPTKLMQYLCRLITQPNGVILDPFAGSGSTGKAAILEGFRFVGIEQDAEYVAIAEARLRHAVANKSGQQGKLDL